MAQDQMSSLFGTTPEALQAQRDAALQQQAMQYAKMDPFQRSTAAIYSGASRLGTGVAGMMGAQDPEMMRTAQRQALFAKARPSDAAGWQRLAQELYAAGDAPGAQEAMAKAASMQAAGLAAEKTRADISLTDQQRLASVATVEGNVVKGKDKKGIAAALKSKFPDLDEAALLGLAGNDKLVADLFKPENVNKKWDTVTTASGVYRVNQADPNERVRMGDAKGSTMDTFAGALAQERLLAAQRQAIYDQEKNEDKRNKLKAEWGKGIQANIFALRKVEDSSATLAKALNLAPKTALGAMMQAAGSAIPWTDQKALANIVGTLQADKVLGTLRDLKSQSATGATGFGALSEKELDLIIKDITALDPTDKNFKGQLDLVFKKLGETEEALKASRRILDETRPGGPKPSGKSQEKKTASGLTYTVETN